MQNQNAPDPKAEGAGKKSGGNAFLPGQTEKVNQQEQLDINCCIVFCPEANTDELPVMYDNPDGRWWRVDPSTVDRQDIPAAAFTTVAADPTLMTALHLGAHVWVREEVAG